jgi:hypothetical protein
MQGPDSRAYHNVVVFTLRIRQNVTAGSKRSSERWTAGTLLAWSRSTSMPS